MAKKALLSTVVLVGLVALGAWLGSLLNEPNGRFVGAAVGAVIWLLVRPRLAPSHSEARNEGSREGAGGLQKDAVTAEDPDQRPSNETSSANLRREDDHADPR